VTHDPAKAATLIRVNQPARTWGRLILFLSVHEWRWLRALACENREFKEGGFRRLASRFLAGCCPLEIVSIVVDVRVAAGGLSSAGWCFLCKVGPSITVVESVGFGLSFGDCDLAGYRLRNMLVNGEL
jgi:hypothetical protein